MVHKAGAVAVRQRYTLSLGSNVRPLENMLAMLAALLPLGEQSLWLSRIIRTAPMGMASDHYFLNTAVCLDTHLSPTDLKQCLIQIELDLGRDRSDPRSKIKDRPADLDIVGACAPGEGFNTAVLPPEPYVRPLVIEIWQAQGQLLHLPAPDLGAGVPLVWRGQTTIGQCPMRLTPTTAVALTPHFALA